MGLRITHKMCKPEEQCFLLFLIYSVPVRFIPFLMINLQGLRNENFWTPIWWQTAKTWAFSRSRFQFEYSPNFPIFTQISRLWGQLECWRYCDLYLICLVHANFKESSSYLFSTDNFWSKTFNYLRIIP